MENFSRPNSTAIYERTEGGLGSSDTDSNMIYRLVLDIIVFLFGVPGNCLILFVYWNKPLKTSTHVFIMGLAWADLCVCLLGVNRICYTAVFVADIIVGGVFLMIEQVLQGFNNVAIGTSIMMTGVIAADRYDCVCRPHRRFFTHRRGKITAGAVLVFSFFINIPAFIPRTNNLILTTVEQAFQVFCFVAAVVMITLCYGKVYLTIKRHLRVHPGAKVEDLLCSRAGDLLSTRLSTAALTTVDPKTNLVSSVSTHVSKPSSGEEGDAGTSQFKRASSRDVVVDKSSLDESEKGPVGRPPSEKMATRTGTSNKTDSRVVSGSGNPSKILDDAEHAVPKADAAVFQRKTTRMLFITSVVFLLTWLPYFMFVAGRFASYTNPAFYEILGKIYAVLYINNAVNPLIYGLANRRFRKDCKLVFKRIKGC